MSKLYRKYEELKAKECDIIYLFLCGNFYIALDSDAILLSELFDMKLTKFSNLCDKCGFPKNSLEKYVTMLENKKIKYKIIEDSKSSDDKVKEIINIINSYELKKLDKNELLEVLIKISKIIE